MKWFKYIGFIFIMTILGCKVEVDPIVPPTELYLNVVNEDETPVNGAAVFIFDTEAAYLAGSVADDGSLAVYTGTTVNGQVHFPDVVEGKIYWIHVFYYDGNGIHRSNMNSQHKLLKPLDLSSITTLKITLEIDDLGRILFWTDANNTANQPIEVFLQNQSVGNLTTTIATTPTLADSNQTLMVDNVLPGSYNWYAKGQNGCLWQGTTTVPGDGFATVNLAECNHGSVYFYTSTTNIANHPSLTIVLDLYDTIPTPLTTGNTGDPGCGGGVTISRPIGVHSYQVLSSTGTCIWTGTVNITEAGCSGVLIEDCN